MCKASVSCLGRDGFPRIAYIAWRKDGATSNVIFVHVLILNGLNFSAFRTKLAESGRVVFPGFVPEL